MSSPTSDSSESAGSRAGNQTLARGLTVLLAIAESGQGLTVHQVSELLGVHRSIAYRLLQTLGDFGLAARTSDGVYAPGAVLATLAGAYLPSLRAVAGPVLRELADTTRTTVALFVEQGQEAVAIAMIEPTTASHHISFRAGMRTPIDRGSAGYAMLALGSATADEPVAVTRAREVGYARSYGEIESGTYGVAAGIPLGGTGPRASLNLISFREEIAEENGPAVRAAAGRIAALLD